MPADFSAAKTSDVYEFLKKAANDATFRNDLKKLEPKALSALLEKDFHVKIPPGEIPKPKDRVVLTKDQSRLLIALFDLEARKTKTLNPYAASKYDYNPSTLGPLIMVIGYAMPLAAVDSEVAAAG
jgi:hypothetical protein